MPFKLHNCAVKMPTIGNHLDKFKKLLGENIKNRRKELDISQEVLAEAIHKESNYEHNLDRSQISRWEKGKNKPDPIYQKLLCKVLKVDDSFFDPISIIQQTKPLDQAFMLTESQLKALSEDAATKGVKAAMDAINKPAVSKQDTKNMSEKDKLILQITSSLPLLNVNNLTGISNSINRLISKGRIKKSVNS